MEKELNQRTQEVRERDKEVKKVWFVSLKKIAQFMVFQEIFRNRTNEFVRSERKCWRHCARQSARDELEQARTVFVMLVTIG